MSETEHFEVNFDGLIGPSHNYAGLSLGNIASASHEGATAFPREAALQGIAKMRLLHSLGLKQGFIPPLERPHMDFLAALGFSGSDDEVLANAWRDDPALVRIACSASSMWTANAATVTAAPDSGDGRVHLTVANLSRMPHRAIEWPATLAWLQQIFCDERHFSVWPAIPASFGDEGAANHMRLAPTHGAPGVDVFVYGENGSGRFPARQDRRASEAVARRHGVQRPVFSQQSGMAIDAGAFHNDVVAVANGDILFAHEDAFADRDQLVSELDALLENFSPVIVPEDEVPLADTITSYLFNSQLLTMPDGSSMLLCPEECRETETVGNWLERNVGGNHPIQAVRFVDVRQSMNNGGGPACLRLRVPMSEEAFQSLDPRFVLSDEVADQLSELVERHWPERTAPADLGTADYWSACRNATRALNDWLGDTRA